MLRFTIVPRSGLVQWLFSTANGHFDIDLAESGIHPHHVEDIKLSKNYDLNYSIDVGQEELRHLIADMYHVNDQRVVITSRQLLDEYKVLLMPAEIFGSSYAIRISFGRPEAILTKGLNRIAHLLNNKAKP